MRGIVQNGRMGKADQENHDRADEEGNATGGKSPAAELRQLQFGYGLIAQKKPPRPSGES
jgi:hypothetical protein